VHDGIWLAEQVRSRWPQTAVIMASSAQDMETVITSRSPSGAKCCDKPCREPEKRCKAPEFTRSSSSAVGPRPRFSSSVCAHRIF
jgi:hypothetical protein